MIELVCVMQSGFTASEIVKQYKSVAKLEQENINMAFDGVTIANVVSELKKELLGGRLNKIAQPEEDELLLTIKQPTGQKRLFLSARLPCL